MHSFIANPPTKGKFVAFYDDGSGCRLFKFDLEYKFSFIIDTDGEACFDSIEDMVEAGYGFWLPIDDNFKYWFERD